MKVRIRPKGPFAPPDPKTKKPIEGEVLVDWSTYWKRRELEGVIEVVPDAPVSLTVRKKIED